MENQLFSIHRFGNYLMKYIAEYRSLRLQFIILTGVFTCIMSISGGKLDFFTLTAFLYIFAIVSASQLSAYFSPRSNKIKFLLVPASQLEKFVAMVVHLYVVIPVMFAVVIFISQYCAMLVTALFTLSMPVFELPYAGVDINSNMLGVYALSYTSAAAFYLMGATFFTRHTFLKTTGLSMAVGFLIMLLMTVGITFHTVSVGAFSQFEEFDKVNTSAGNFIIVISVMATLLYLTIAYLRMTEMEVNETKK